MWFDNKRPKALIFCTRVQLIIFFDESPWKTKHDGRGHWGLAFCHFQFSSCWGEVKNVSVNLGSGQPSCWQKNTTVVKDIEDFLSSLVKFIGNQWLQKKCKKWVSQLEPGWPPLLTNHPKNAKVVEDAKYLLPAKFHQIPLNSCRKVENIVYWALNSPTSLTFTQKP